MIVKQEAGKCLVMRRNVEAKWCKMMEVIHMRGHQMCRRMRFISVCQGGKGLCGNVGHSNVIIEQN